VDEIQPRVALKAQQMVGQQVPRMYRKNVVTTSCWCMLKYCMECEYRDVVRVDHYHTLWQIFKAGHFPCGIRYVTDEITLVVF
jgi:hypothetical protein